MASTPSSSPPTSYSLRRGERPTVGYTPHCHRQSYPLRRPKGESPVVGYSPHRHRLSYSLQPAEKEQLACYNHHRSEVGASGDHSLCSSMDAATSDCKSPELQHGAWHLTTAHIRALPAASVCATDHEGCAEVRTHLQAHHQVAGQGTLVPTDHEVVGWLPGKLPPIPVWLKHWEWLHECSN